MTKNGDDRKEFYNESDFSKYFFNLLNIHTTKLVSIQNKPEDPYLSTFLPLFYLDQDLGYSGIYKAPSNFIKDQYTEMVRLALGFPPKNSFEKKRAVLQVKESINSLDHEIVASRQLITKRSDDLGHPRRPALDIQREIDECHEELNSIKHSGNQINESLLSLDNYIDNKKRAFRGLLTDISDLSEKLKGIEKIKHEIESEINTLSLNAEAHKVFQSFQDICSSSNCSLFMSSSESYGKNLLYLRDQIKDLDRNTEISGIRHEELLKKKIEMESELIDLTSRRSALQTESGSSTMVEAIGQLTRRTFDLERLLSLTTNLEREETRYIKLTNDREDAQNRLADMQGVTNSEDLKFLQLKTTLRKRIANWLDILVTTNVSRNISLEADLIPIFGKESVNQLKGSTRTRAVLATHAAIFETYLDDDSNTFRIFVMDTPKQHEMHTEHLAGFIGKLSQLAKSKNAQIFFSTTEYHYLGDEDDKEWNPNFPGEEHNMYMGPPSTEPTA